MSAPSLKLVSFTTCPYVQRSWAALELKGAVYDIVFIDLKDKPDWFVRLNPRGKVPVLVVDEAHVIYESTVINELLEELLPEPALLPSDPLERARARMWIDHADSYVMSALSTRMFTRDRAAFDETGGALLKAFGMVQTELVERDVTGWFCGGDRPGLVEATWAPIFDRLPAVRELWGWELPGSLKRLLAWGERMLDDAHIARTRLPEPEEAYRPYREAQQKAFTR